MAKRRGRKPEYYRTAFTVEGRGDFPIDMLRYDSCHPATESDANAVGRTTEEREIRLRRYSPEPNGPTEARWKSFGWEVTDVSLVEA